MNHSCKLMWSNKFLCLLLFTHLAIYMGCMESKGSCPFKSYGVDTRHPCKLTHQNSLANTRLLHAIYITIRSSVGWGVPSTNHTHSWHMISHVMGCSPKLIDQFMMWGMIIIFVLIINSSKCSLHSKLLASNSLCLLFTLWPFSSPQF